MRRPFLDNREAQFFAFPRRFAEERNLAGFALARDPRGIAQHGVGGFDKLAAVGRKRIECAGSHKAFKGALITNFGSIRRAKSPIERNGPPSARAPTTCSIACLPTPFTAASA